MKRFLLLISFALIALASMAQTGQIAILSHQGEMRVFYGSIALREAYDNAQVGDVITLSSGSFQAVDFQKAVTVRGAGINVGEDGKNILPTYIAGETKIHLPEEMEDRLSFEGIIFTDRVEWGLVKQLQFLKCIFRGNIWAGDGDLARHQFKTSSYTFIHCYLIGQACLNVGNSLFVNSVLTQWYRGRQYYVGQSFNNCIILPKETMTPNIDVTNSIVLKSSNNVQYIGAATANYVIVVDTERDYKDNITNAVYVDSVEKLFKEDSFYQLTDYALEILGADGTQLGIYGGNIPFSAVPTGPKVKKFNVASKTTADGKLSVDIEIDNAE